jgi:hypothetical protein
VDFQGCWGYEAAGTFARIHDVAGSVLVSVFLMAVGLGALLATVRVLRTVRGWSWRGIWGAIIVALAIGVGGTAASGYVHSEARCPRLSYGDIYLDTRIDRSGFPAYFSVVLAPDSDVSSRREWEPWALVPNVAFYSTLALVALLGATSSWCRSRSPLPRANARKGS